MTSDEPKRAAIESAPPDKVRKPSPYSSPLKLPCRLVSEDFHPEGDLSKKAWRGAERVPLGLWSGGKAPPEVETSVATGWSASHLYCAFRCKYSVLNVYEGEDPTNERWGLWDRDVVEVFVNPEPERANHYYEFEVAPNNQWIDLEIDLDKKPFNDAGWNSGFQHAARIDRKRRVWTCEMSIPFNSMNVERLRPNSEWRINFYRAAGLGDDTRRHFLCWSPVPGERPNFHQPSRFGRIRFVKP